MKERMSQLQNYEKVSESTFRAIAVDQIMKKRGISEKEAEEIYAELSKQDIYSAETKIDDNTHSIRHHIMVEIGKI